MCVIIKKNQLNREGRGKRKAGYDIDRLKENDVEVDYKTNIQGRLNGKMTFRKTGRQYNIL